VFRCDRGDYTRVLPTHCTRGCGCNGHPAFPTPSLFWAKNSRNDPGASRRGARTRVYTQLSSPAKAGDPVIRSVSDGMERPLRTGYPAGACHRARRRRDPVAGYDGCLRRATCPPELNERSRKRRSNLLSPLSGPWIASRSLSSGAHSRDPLASIRWPLRPTGLRQARSLNLASQNDIVISGSPPATERDRQ
jgi:hypothetical protein